MAKKRPVKDNNAGKVKSRIFLANNSSGARAEADNSSIGCVKETSNKVNMCVSNVVSDEKITKVESGVSSACGVDRRTMHHSIEVDSVQENGVSQSITDTLSTTFYDQNNGTQSNPCLQVDNPHSMNTEITGKNLVCYKVKPICDVNYCGFDDKFATSIMFSNQKKGQNGLESNKFTHFSSVA